MSNDNFYYKNIRKYLLRQTDKCALCGEKFLNYKDVSIDHIKPTSKGGSDHISNLQLAHKDCNIKKGNKDVSQCRSHIWKKSN